MSLAARGRQARTFSLMTRPTGRTAARNGPCPTPALLTTRGRRATNQDRVCAIRLVVAGHPAVLLAVADGMGGMQAGEQAAEEAIQAAVGAGASGRFEHLPFEAQAIRAALVETVLEANRQISDWATAHGLSGEVGSTLVCCLVWHRSYLVVHVGDSRCYYINDYEARPLTEDHTQAQTLVRKGVMTPQAARGSPFSSQLTSSLGETTAPTVDLSPPGDHVGVIDEACALMVCSDGLHGVLAPEDIQRVFRTTDSAEAACRGLVALASERGSADNISVAAVEIGRLRRSPRLRDTPPRRRRGRKPLVVVAALAACGGLLAARSTITLPSFGSRLGPAPPSVDLACNVVDRQLNCRWRHRKTPTPPGKARLELASEATFASPEWVRVFAPDDSTAHCSLVADPRRAALFARVVVEAVSQDLPSNVIALGPWAPAPVSAPAVPSSPSLPERGQR
jgi:protein phosphatase